MVTAPIRVSSRSNVTAAALDRAALHAAKSGITEERSMQAIVQDTYGSADVLQLREIDRPQIGADEVLIRVHAAGVDFGVWHLMAGLPYAVRLVMGVREPRNPRTQERRPSGWISSRRALGREPSSLPERTAGSR